MRVYLVNILFFALLLITYYLLAFLSGYASKAGYFREEFNLFLKFFVFHFLLNFYLLYKLRQLKWVPILFSTLLIFLLYLLAALKFWYLK